MTAVKKIAIGAKFEVIGFNNNNPAYRKKLLAMGITIGAVFSVTRIAPLGDPIEIKVRDASLVLRKNEAKILKLKPYEKSNHSVNR
jgi:ferrous iron transport protein A